MPKPKDDSPSARKRKARVSDRIYAAELARLYRERHPRVADQTANGKDIVVRGIHRGGPDIGDALDWFAKHGTWEKSAADIALWNAMAYRYYFKQLRAGGMASEDAIAQLAEEAGVSERTVRGAVYSRGNKTTAR